MLSEEIFTECQRVSFALFYIHQSKIDTVQGYYTSLNFIMTFIAICLGSISAYLGWVLPANTL